MKTLGKFIISICFYSIFSQGFAQSPPSSQIEEMIQKMEKRMDAMMQGFGQDPMFRSLLDESFGPRDVFSGNGDAFEYYYSNEDKGRTLVIIPQSKKHKLEIQVSGENVDVSGQIKTEKVEKTKHGESRSTSFQSVHHSLPVPKDCLGSKNKITETEKGNKKEIHVFFPYKNGKPGNPGFLPSHKTYAKKKQQGSSPAKEPNSNQEVKPSKVDDDEMIPLFPEGGDTI